MIPAGVVAVGVSWHRMCFPCPCRPRGGVQPGLPCGPRSFFKCVCRDMRRTPEAGARLARYAGNASLCMRGHARAGGCSGGPVVPRCLPPGLCMPPHTRRNGSPKAIIFGSRMPCLSCVWCLACRFMVGVCRGGCPGVPVSCVRVWDSPGVSGMPCRDHPGVFACVSGYAEREGARVVSPPCEVWVRRRATLPHPSGCSTIAVPGLSFRVRNGSGRLPWAMAAANLQLSSHRPSRPWGLVVGWGPDSGRDRRIDPCDVQGVSLSSE